MVGCITDPMDMSLSKLQEVVKEREVQRAAVHGVTKSDMTELLNNKVTPVSESTALGFHLYLTSWMPLLQS